MKKVFAIIMTLAIAMCLCITGFAEDKFEPVDYADSTAHAISFDGIYKNKKRINNPDGRASMWMDENLTNRTLDGSDGSYKTIGVRGWVGFNDQEVDQIGYTMDGQTPVFGSWKENTEAVVKEEENGGQYATRFTIYINVEGLEGFHTIGIVAKLTDGTIVLLDSKEPNRHDTIADMTFNFQGPGATPSPTPDPTPEPTDTPAPTEAPAENETQAPAKSSGCGSIISASYACILVAGCALILKRKSR